eukprot:scaffold97114_cov63-Phaeocystis_antarctica.AAC.1
MFGRGVACWCRWGCFAVAASVASGPCDGPRSSERPYFYLHRALARRVGGDSADVAGAVIILSTHVFRHTVIPAMERRVAALSYLLQFSLLSLRFLLRVLPNLRRRGRGPACVRLVHAWPDTWRSPTASAFLGLGLVGAEAAAIVLVSGSGLRAGAGALFRGRV